MKEFFKYVAATLVGLIIYGIIQVVMFISCIAGIAAAGAGSGTSGVIKDNSVLVIKLDGNILDRTSDTNPFSSLMGNISQELSLDDMVNAIEKAKTSDEIKGIYIEAGNVSAEPASYTALRNALADFKTSKKWIVSYADNYSQGAYYISSVADKVWINPQGMLSWHGMGGSTQYLKGLLSKFGVKMQVVKVGTYKSATETYTEDHMSDANREQTMRYVSGIWNTFIADVAKSRNISKDSLNAYADRVMDFESTDNLKKYKFIDGVMYADQIKVEIKKLLGIKEKENINQVNIADAAALPSENANSKDKIAIYYCEGSIVQQPEQSVIMGGESGIVGPDVCRDIEELMNDETVKAVVIRINSGGGDAYASEQMWHQIVSLKAKKPVVVSMGGMAASGGYYMGCGANWIVAEPTTLTGSIGIFGVFPDASELITEKLGVKFDEVKTNKNSTMSVFSYARPFNAEEQALLQKYIDRGYALFKKRVADGRHMSVDDVEKIAQGHVWLGEDAIKIKLVDQLGSLNDAVKKAATLSKVTEYSVEKYPAPEDWTASLMNMTDNGTYLDEAMKATLGDLYGPFTFLKTLNRQSPIQARMPNIIRFE